QWPKRFAYLAIAVLFAGCGEASDTTADQFGQATAALGIGAMYSGAYQFDDCGGNANDVPNKVWGGDFCPPGVPAIRSGRILGPESRCGVNQYQCSSNAQLATFVFGGMYQYTDPCPPGTCFTGNTNNELTGAPSCPRGYTANWMGRVLQPEEGRGANQYVCTASASNTPMRWVFGGVYQRDDCGQVHVNNTFTGALSCPFGYTSHFYGRVKVSEGSQCGANQYVCIRQLF
ncbi:MAG: hypothetical protein QOI66_2225, partial [Myxococcales bacterium]|nr:hypothetical protein [Myxococcales bacterium]